ncbi:hypothetical protein R3P38DRAFT_3195598 [Favolaschia claudopus]|uniref:Uncharacterized protein n=1 Tax=Favolaschia claudopus TaxID=2862362 RepID=A0AAW0BBB0_9AGAR
MNPTSPTPSVSCVLAGFFPVRQGTKTTVSRGEKSTPYFVYETTLYCLNGVRSAAALRVYASESYPVPDDTVLYVVAKAVFPVGQNILLEAIRAAPVPGDPSSDEYQLQIPDMMVPTIVAVGHVSSMQQKLSDKYSSRAFTVNTGDYVRDQRQTCTIQAVYDGGNKRWLAMANVPPQDSCVQIVGICREIFAGVLRVNVDTITLNMMPINTSTVATTTEPGTPGKKRKFSAYADDAPITPSAPHSFSSPSHPNSGPPIASSSKIQLPHTPVTPSPMRRQPTSSQHEPPSPDPFISSAPVPHYDAQYQQYLLFLKMQKEHEQQHVGSQSSITPSAPHTLLPAPPLTTPIASASGSATTPISVDPPTTPPPPPPSQPRIPSIRLARPASHRPASSRPPPAERRSTSLSPLPEEREEQLKLKKGKAKS